MDRTAIRPEMTAAPLAYFRETPLGEISVDQADTVTHEDDAEPGDLARVDVANFGSSI